MPFAKAFLGDGIFMKSVEDFIILDSCIHRGSSTLEVNCDLKNVLSAIVFIVRRSSHIVIIIPECFSK